MAPRSWKPDNSLIDAVPVDNMETEDAVDDRASSVMAYHAYRLGISFLPSNSCHIEQAALMTKPSFIQPIFKINAAESFTFIGMKLSVFS